MSRTEKSVSLLRSAVVFYDNSFLALPQADRYFEILKAFPFKYDTYMGRPLRRQTCALYTESMEPYISRIPAIWGDNIETIRFTPELLELKHYVERRVYDWTKTQWNYDLCLGNKYIGGKDIIGEHSDREEYGNSKSIASLSFGVRRQFIFSNKQNRQDSTVMTLDHGSLLFMGESCQENYTHRMIEEDLSKLNLRSSIDAFGQTRFNLTFRIFRPILQDEYIIA